MSRREDAGDSRSSTTRRDVLSALTTLGVGTVAFQRCLAQDATDQGTITDEMIGDAEWVAGIDLTEEQRGETAQAVEGVLDKRRQIREVAVGYDVLPAIRFDPEMYGPVHRSRSLEKPAAVTPAEPALATVPEFDGDVSFRSIRELGTLLRSGKVSAVELAEKSIQRLTDIDPVLHLVVTLTRELAMKQAEKADQELKAGMDRGPLHGIPWCAKDLIAVEGYPTTWGAPQFRDQVLSSTATVAQRLQNAGATLVAKVSLGALAMGDKWFGGMTRNPWNPEQGSSGSSAGSAAAVAAGAVPFALGSETLGSIVSPCRRCGVTGLRPTFGRVSRSGCMALSWTMDKIGPIARTIDDCGIVFNTIHGKDHADPCTVDRWFEWPVRLDLSKVTVGQVVSFPTSTADQLILDVLEQAGANIIPVRLPDQIPEWAVSLMLDAEAATIFHQLVEDNDTDGLNRWPSIFRKMHFFSAVDYLQAARVRSLLMKEMASVFRTVDLYVGGSDLGICNLTGHPTVALPSLMNAESDHPQPVCGTLTGRLHSESLLLAAAGVAEASLNIGSHRPKL